MSIPDIRWHKYRNIPHLIFPSIDTPTAVMMKEGPPKQQKDSAFLASYFEHKPFLHISEAVIAAMGYPPAIPLRNMGNITG